MPIYIGDKDEKAKTVCALYAGDPNNTARRVIRVYAGDSNNKAKLIYDDTVRDLSAVSFKCTAIGEITTGATVGTSYLNCPDIVTKATSGGTNGNVEFETSLTLRKGDVLRLTYAVDTLKATTQYILATSFCGKSFSTKTALFDGTVNITELKKKVTLSIMPCIENQADTLTIRDLNIYLNGALIF